MRAPTPLLRRALSLAGENRGASLGIAWNAVLLIVSVAALPWDHRTILGLNPWIKPIKFQISTIIYLATVSLLLAALDDEGARTKLRAGLSWGFGLAMVVENSLITLQAARGVRSHMNYTSALNGSIFGVMGVFIAINTLLLGILLLLYWNTPPERPLAELWGIRLGLIMILAGSLEGARIVAHGTHTVGAPDGGPGLPFLNWNIHYGDLRVAHFLALHALQLLWLAGWLLGRSRAPRRLSVAAIWVVAGLYAAMVSALFLEAVSGRPFIARM